MLYRYEQNNSWWITINDNIICEVMIIEADNEKEAEQKAEELGIYFEWCEDWRDCEYCWDRWSRYADEIKFPYKWSEEKIIKDLDEYISYIILWENNLGFFWKRTTRIFFKDWTIKEFNI